MLETAQPIRLQNRRFRRYLPGHQISTTRGMNWDTLANGVLYGTGPQRIVKSAF